MPNYGEARYWDERYTQQKNTTFDWLESWDDVKEITQKYAIDGLCDAKGNVAAESDMQEVK